ISCSVPNHVLIMHITACVNVRLQRPPISTLFPYTTLFRSIRVPQAQRRIKEQLQIWGVSRDDAWGVLSTGKWNDTVRAQSSERGSVTDDSAICGGMPDRTTGIGSGCES